MQFNPKVAAAIREASMKDRNGRSLSWEGRRTLAPSEVAEIQRRVGGATAVTEGTRRAVSPILTEMSTIDLIEHISRSALAEEAPEATPAPAKPLSAANGVELSLAVAAGAGAHAQPPDLAGADLAAQEADVAISRDGSVPLDQRDAAFYRAAERLAARRPGGVSPFWAKP